MLHQDCFDEIFSKQEDVTRKTVKYLFDDLRIDPDVTLRDIFGLFKYCPELFHVYDNLFFKKFVDEVNSSRKPQAEDRNPDGVGLKIYREWTRNTGSGSILQSSPHILLTFFGEDFSSLASTCPVERGLDAKISLHPNISIMEMDRYSNKFGMMDGRMKTDYLSLGRLLDAVKTSMADYARRYKYRDQINNDFDDRYAWNEYYSYDESMNGDFDEVSNLRRIFKSLGRCTVDQIKAAVKNAPDKIRAKKWLKYKLGKEIQLHAACSRMNGRELRIALWGV